VPYRTLGRISVASCVSPNEERESVTATCNNCGGTTAPFGNIRLVGAKSELKSQMIPSTNLRQSWTEYRDVRPYDISICLDCLRAARRKMMRRGITALGCLGVVLTIVFLLIALSPKGTNATQVGGYALLALMWIAAFYGLHRIRRDRQLAAPETVETLAAQVESIGKGLRRKFGFDESFTEAEWSSVLAKAKRDEKDPFNVYRLPQL
jgi:hypothetical protein